MTPHPLNPSANDYVIYELTLAGAEAVTDLHLAVGTSVISEVLGLLVSAVIQLYTAHWDELKH